MPKFTTDVVIGLEIHVELDTKSKIFCSCPTHGSDEPNSRVCPVCLGFPGSKPVLNKKAVEYALRLCLALDCEIAPRLVFSRKSYFYPDMAKNYQISQYEIPLGNKGVLELASEKKVGITRVHMEEDPASLVYPGTMANSPFVLVDYNRSGNPLVEVVTEPDMASPDEARDFMRKLITVLSYLQIFDVDNGIIKADANVSIKESGYIRAEIKNITGFKEIERALNYEVARQKKESSEGKKFVQETRAWDPDLGITRSLRTKETEADYGYIIDPDLVATDITGAWLDDVKSKMPELSHQKVKRFILQHKISKLDAEVIAQDRLLAELYEKVAQEVDPILAAKWLRRELVRVLNYNKKEVKDLVIDEKHLITLLKLVETKKITETTGQRILEKLIESPFDVSAYVKKENLEVVADTGVLEAYCREAIANNSKAVEEFKAGNEKSLNFLIGQVMKKTKGTASPKEVNDLMKSLIG